MSASLRTEGPLQLLWKRYSSWYALKRAVAWLCKVFWHLRQKSRPRDCQGLNMQDLHGAEKTILKQIQREAYPEEFKQITRRRLPRQSHLYRLEPYVHEGLLRVGGRFRHTQSSVGEGILLPTDHPVTRLIIMEMHCTRAGHMGREHTLALLRERYWVPRPRTVLDKILRQCIICRRNNFRPRRQREADLPMDRTTPGGLPFESTGLDAFGPIMVKWGRKQAKRFGCLFTCMRTRAVHLEVLESLEADALLNAITRFVSRRGTPTRIRSDNGTNMVAADKELRTAMRQLSDDKAVSARLQRKGIEWTFIPPAAPHMGGAWERQVGTVKRVLRAIIGSQSIDDYRLATLFCEAEAIVNSRPITPVSSDPNDFEALTPSHLLRGGAGDVFPLHDRSLNDEYRRRWQHVQVLAERFWRRFVREYVPSLRKRHKHLQPRPNLQRGDLVIITTEEMPRCSWPLGRVVEVMPGTDGLVRRARVKTAKREFIRSVDKLCLLEGVTE